MNHQPNLIYVFADQLRWSNMGYNGDALAKTPHIDALASQSCNLCNAVSGHPVCAPYRASLFTGKYTTSTGMVINELRINPNHRCFAHVLNDGGYETCYIGKWHMYAAQLGHHYDSKNSFIPKGPDRLGFDDYYAAYNFHHEYNSPPAYYHLDTPEKLYYGGYEPDCQTDMAIAQLRRLSAQNKPFALFLSIGTPHDPWTPDNVPKRYFDMFRDAEIQPPPNYSPRNDPHADMWARLKPKERRKLRDWIRVYYAMIANLDDNVGRLVNAVKALGLDGNSIFVFTSDHGEMFGAHGRRAKNIFYDEAARVPFLLRYSDSLAAGCNDVCLNTVDIMPTLLSMMGLPVPDSVEGTDRSEEIKNGPDTESGALMMGTGPTAIFGNGREWRAWRTNRYTYAVYRADGSEYLFDNRNDPFQMKNLSEDCPTKKEQLKAAMYKKMAEIGDNFEKSSYYRKHWIVNRCIREELK